MKFTLFNNFKDKYTIVIDKIVTSTVTVVFQKKPKQTSKKIKNNMTGQPAIKNTTSSLKDQRSIRNRCKGNLLTNSFIIFLLNCKTNCFPNQ